jgi:hypothetical protein
MNAMQKRDATHYKRANAHMPALAPTALKSTGALDVDEVDASLSRHLQPRPTLNCISLRRGARDLNSYGSLFGVAALAARPHAGDELAYQRVISGATP